MPNTAISQNYESFRLMASLLPSLPCCSFTTGNGTKRGGGRCTMINWTETMENAYLNNRILLAMALLIMTATITVTSTLA